MKTKNSRGFTLLEVLIALVIFSFGLLALAALMAKGLQYNTSALHRSYASSQAYDMADRMRANRLGIDAGNYEEVSGAGSDPGCITSGCNPAQMAQYERGRTPKRQRHGRQFWHHLYHHPHLGR